MRKALTAKTIEALKPGTRRYDVHDVLCPGLSVRVGKQGQKTFTVKYRYGLKQRRLRLGVHPRISLAQAREKALEALRNVDEGIDPAARRRQLSTRVQTVCEDFIRQHASRVTAVGQKPNASCSANSLPFMVSATFAKSGDAVPFKFDLTNLLARARRQVADRVGDVTLNLPFISSAVSPKDRERRVAREVVLRLRDRRVLSAWECCDDCIDKALTSLREIRQIIVDEEVKLADLQDGPLFLLLDAMAIGIRQFMTFEELLRRSENAPRHPRFGEFRRPIDVRQSYFDGLEILRGHLSRCLGQIASISGMPEPTDGIIENYMGPWQLEAYQTPQLTAPPE